MRALFVTHGNDDPEAREMLGAFLAEASRLLPCEVGGATLRTLSRDLRPGDRVFALFYSEGGHVQRDLLPPVRAAAAIFEGIIPAAVSAAFFRGILVEKNVPPGTRVLLVGVKAVTDPALKEASLTTLAGELSRLGYPSSFGLYNDEATLPSGSADASPPTPLLLTLLPGYTLSKAREIFALRGVPLIAEAWLPAMTPSLLRWAAERLPAPTTALNGGGVPPGRVPGDRRSAPPSSPRSRERRGNARRDGGHQGT